MHAVSDRDWQLAQAERNFDVARRYSKPELDRVRSEFWGGFTRAIAERGA